MRVCVITLLLFCGNVLGSDLTRQIILVEATNAHSQYGHLWLLDEGKNHAWHAVMQTPVVLGKNGVSAHRHEGDNKTPLGIYKIHTAFGFSPKALNPKLQYHQILPDTNCIDDSKSRYYNQIIELHSVTKDWDSSEQMHTIPLYHYGLFIPFNQQKQPGKGSCIFIHIWKNSHTGTAGCIAMPLPTLKLLIKNLGPFPSVSITAKNS
jgi:L,D-peptidoglycan transpeptidase YkuD (ErfK/YbiS/YcfS/YnhG family)